jgi:hypothetical protein
MESISAISLKYSTPYLSFNSKTSVNVPNPALTKLITGTFSTSSG